MHRAFYYRNKRHSRTKYVYYIRGRKLAIVEWDGEDWISPKATNTFLAEQNGADIEPTGGFLLEYTYLPSLPASEINDVDLDYEIQESIKMIIKNTSLDKVDHYAYPEGLDYCFSDRVINVLKKNGIKSSPTAISGYNDANIDMFHLKRFLIT